MIVKGQSLRKVGFNDIALTSALHRLTIAATVRRTLGQFKYKQKVEALTKKVNGVAVHF